jgi:proteasome lid subunit RPN8/RPN11
MSGSGEMAGKGGGRLNTVQKMCTHACKCKNDTCCNFSMNGGGEDKEEQFKYDIVDTL